MDDQKRISHRAAALGAAAGDGSGRARLNNREVRHGSENSRIRLASWRWPRVRRDDCRSEFRFDPRGSPGQLSARPSIRGKQMRGVRGSWASPKMSAGPGIRRKHEPLHHGRAGGEMSAGPGIRRKHEPLCHGRAGGEMSAGPRIRRKHEPLRHGRAGGEMSAGPGIRRKDKSLRLGAITLDQRHRDKNGEISGRQVGWVKGTLNPSNSGSRAG
jgi:hypothetical protein